MHLVSKNVDIKNISETDLIKHKSKIIYLLEDNYKINFPNSNNFIEFADIGYTDMVRYYQDNSAILIGAFKDNEIIGFLWAYKRNILGENRIHINHIIVNFEFRSSGIGSKLLCKLEELSINEDIKKIELMTTKDNENTMKFYKLMGFSEVRVQLEKELGKKDDCR